MHLTHDKIIATETLDRKPNKWKILQCSHHRR
jgi:hypothetical protein